MNKPYFHKLFDPQLENPIFIEGLTGLGNVGLIAARNLIDLTGAKVFAELYAPYFPDYVIVKKDGTCHPPRYQFYSAKTKNNQYIILTGISQPSMEDSLAHYDICDEILDFGEKYGSKFIITMGGISTSKPANEIYIAATSDELAKKYVEKGIKIYSEGRIIGTTGLLLGLAKRRGWKGICLLGTAAGFGTERGIGLSLFKILANILEEKEFLEKDNNIANQSKPDKLQT
ncbi:MAG: PAC2 family protein [Candidatus Bathyarchaeota archaeon]